MRIVENETEDEKEDSCEKKMNISGEEYHWSIFHVPQHDQDVASSEGWRS